MPEQDSAGGYLGIVVATARHMAIMVVAIPRMIGHALFKDGKIDASMRQAADELGLALKAFPDSIQTEEVGTILNPTQGEIASARNPSSRLYGRPPQPSAFDQIKNDRTAYRPEPEQGRQHQREMEI